MNPGRAGQLRDPDDGVLHVARRDHHQVSQLVDDDQQVRVRHIDPLAAGRRGYLSCPDRLVEVIHVPETGRGQIVVAAVHLPDHPLERVGGLLGVRDDLGDQVRYPGVGRQLDPLRVDQDHPHLVRRGPHKDRRDQAVDAGRVVRGDAGPARQVQAAGAVDLDAANRNGPDCPHVHDVPLPRRAGRLDRALLRQLAVKPKYWLVRPECHAVGHRRTLAAAPARLR